MEIRDLRFFCLTAELGSVTRAAEQLHVSQPFVTRVIHQLENELGSELFDLEKRRLILNKNGIYFYKEAREILDRLDRAASNLSSMQAQAEFTTTLLYNNAGYLSVLNNAFIERYPNSILSEAYAKPYQTGASAQSASVTTNSAGKLQAQKCLRNSPWIFSPSFKAWQTVYDRGVSEQYRRHTHSRKNTLRQFIIRRRVFFIFRIFVPALKRRLCCAP